MGGGGPSGPKEEVGLARSATAFGVFAAGNIGLNYFNSWALRDSPEGIPGLEKGGFGFPFLYTSFHMAASALAAVLMMATCAKPQHGGLPSAQQFWAYKHQLVPIAFLTVVNTGLNNYSLHYIALFMNQVIKACAPMPTAIFEYALLGKVYPWTIYATVMLIIIGSILSNAHAMLEGGTSDVIGVVMCLISLVAASLNPVIKKIVLSGSADLPQLAPSQVLFWDTALACLGLVVLWLIDFDNTRAASIDYLSGNTENPNSGWLGLGIITAGSAMAFMFNIALYYYILYTSALTSTIGSIGVKIFLICVSAFTDGVWDPLSWTGITLVVLAIVLYGYLSFGGGGKAAAPPPPSIEEPLAKAPPDEGTPLTRAHAQLTQVASAYPLALAGGIAAVTAALTCAIAIPIVIVVEENIHSDGNTTMLRF